MRSRFVRHPRGYGGDRPVRLRNDDQLSTTISVLLGNEHRLTAPRVKRIENPPLDRVLTGSMSLFRAEPGSPGYRCSAPTDGLRSCGAYVLIDIVGTIC